MNESILGPSDFEAHDLLYNDVPRSFPYSAIYFSKESPENDLRNSRNFIMSSLESNVFNPSSTNYRMRRCAIAKEMPFAIEY